MAGERYLEVLDGEVLPHERGYPGGPAGDHGPPVVSLSLASAAALCMLQAPRAVCRHVFALPGHCAGAGLTPRPGGPLLQATSTPVQRVVLVAAAA